ncbi:MAG: hypothetical protein R3F17_08905 [Planctomycetota bacterium]
MKHDEMAWQEYDWVSSGARSVGRRTAGDRNESPEVIHQNSLGVMKMLVSWFTFFSATNYATMGWLAAPYSNREVKRGLLVGLALFFIVQNGVGACANLQVRKYFRDLLCNLRYRHFLDGRQMPEHLYLKATWLVYVGLVFNCVCWAALIYLGG